MAIRRSIPLTTIILSATARSSYSSLFSILDLSQNSGVGVVNNVLLNIKRS